MKIALNFLLFSLIILVVPGCAVYDVSWPSPSNGLRGEVNVDPGVDPYPHMQYQCSGYGGLIFSSVQQGRSRGLGNFKTYQCYKAKETTVVPIHEPQPQYFAPRTQQPSPPSSINNNSLDQFKTICKELGFKEGTEAFGNCVLKLSK